MKHLFVPFELAKKLKDKGFDEPCLGFYMESGSLNYEIKYGSSGLQRIDLHETKTLAPLYQQVIDWLREKHEILINIERGTLGNYYGKIINDYSKVHIGSGNFTFFDNQIDINNNYDGFKTYYEALNAAIEESLKLI